MTLLFVFKAVTLLSPDYSPRFDYFIVYLLLAAINLVQATVAYKTDKTNFIKNICFAVVFISSGTYVFLADRSIVSDIVLMESFLAVMLVNRILGIIKSHKWSYRLIYILIAIAIVFIMVRSLWLETENSHEFLLTHAFLVAIKSLSVIISISFTHLRYGVLRKIIRKTFAAEILFGLVLLIGSFSFVFQALESDIKTYADAVWYCFAVVTTIGFGDYTVTNLFSRALSVILGAYGIVVVALITSIIVNFYNEVKNDKDNDDDDELPETADSLKETAAQNKE